MIPRQQRTASFGRRVCVLSGSRAKMIERPHAARGRVYEHLVAATRMHELVEREVRRQKDRWQRGALDEAERVRQLEHLVARHVDRRGVAAAWL